MADRDILQIDPVKLHLPNSLRDGADFLKLQRQFARYGKSTNGMPPLEVSRGIDGAYVINDGVTRATRVARYLPGHLVTVEVIDEIPISVADFLTIGETL